MLDLKNWIAKVSESLKPRVISTLDSAEFSISGVGNVWTNVDFPTSWKEPVVIGYYITSGTGSNASANLYALYQSDTRVTAAVRNTQASTLTTRVRFYVRHF